MPYKSQAQRAYMHIHHPEVAKRWDREYPHQGKLPKHVRHKRALKKRLERKRKRNAEST